MTRCSLDPLYPKPGSPVQSCLKFSAVLGVTSSNNSISTRPSGSSSALSSKKTRVLFFFPEQKSRNHKPLPSTDQDLDIRLDSPQELPMVGSGPGERLLETRRCDACHLRPCDAVSLGIDPAGQRKVVFQSRSSVGTQHTTETCKPGAWPGQCPVPRGRW